jgi:PIN domain-containing protein
MSRSKKSAERPPNPPLEFLFDRSLGRAVPAELRKLGWRIHLIADVFPDDAQDIADDAWIDYGLVRHWVPVCKDGRIRGRTEERHPLVVHGAVLFYLDNQQLRIAEMITRLEENRSRIEQAARRGGPAICAISADRVRRTWP